KRKHEAVLCLAAQFAQPEAVSFLQDATHDRIYVALSGERLERLQIVHSQTSSTSHQEMTPTASVDLHARTRNGITTHDYASTIRALIDPTTYPDDIMQPGHISLLHARSGGILRSRGYPEACIDLLRIAGLELGAVICKIALPDHSLSDQQALLNLAAQWR